MASGAWGRPTPWAAPVGRPTPPGRRCGASHTLGGAVGRPTPWAALWSVLHPGRRCWASRTLAALLGVPHGRRPGAPRT